MLLVVGAVILGILGGLAAPTGPFRPPAARPLRTGRALAAGAGMILALTGDLLAGSAGVTFLEVGMAVLVAAVGSVAAGRPGLVLVAVGIAANLAVITANAGMPVRGLAAGSPAGHSHHVPLTSRDRLPALADQFRLGGEVVSPGDAAVAGGAAVAAFATVRRRRRSRPSRPAPIPSAPTAAL